MILSDKTKKTKIGGLFLNNTTVQNKNQSEIKPKIKITRIPKIDIDPGRDVYCTRQGSYYAEVVCLDRLAKAHIKKLSKYQYEVIKTKEIKEYKHGEEKTIKNIRVAMRKLKGLIRHNFGENQESERHITLTYQRNMTDSEQLFRDFDVWYKRLRRNYPSHKFEYIAVAEPQERGAWHMHLLLKTDQPSLFLRYDTTYNPKNIRTMWREVIKGGGAVRVEKIEERDVGYYFESYFTKVIPECVEVDGTFAERKAASKAAEKGSRLHMYPPYMKFYRCSRGIKRPEQKIEQYQVVEDEYDKPFEIEAFRLEKEGEMGDLHEFQKIQRQTHHKPV